MTIVGLFCDDHRSFKDIVDFYCRRKYVIKRRDSHSPIFIRPDGTEVMVVYIKGERNIQGKRFDKICREAGMEWTEEHRYCLEIIAARSGRSYSELYKSSTIVPHPLSPEYENKKKLKIFKGLGT